MEKLIMNFTIENLGPHVGNPLSDKNIITTIISRHIELMWYY